ncbi:hypothetical protein LCGC14_0497330 [marine sediment metagenome]|uniref:Uncharacterized protein n=1 Tax=marine sediment metagenome TaxID=412755 RepID=A0A0F9S4T7_9ZZZZ
MTLPFEHEYGDRFHHMSMMRTAKLDEEYGGYVPGTGPSNRRFWLHELLDDYFFYPVRDWMSKWVGDNGVYDTLRGVLGFFWGFNCGFPARDVARYTVWHLRGCKEDS